MLNSILFLDIETVPQSPSYADLDLTKQAFWVRKESYLSAEPIEEPGSLYPRAGIYAEFGKIVCISVGLFKNQQLHIKSYAGDDEFQLLKDFSLMCTKLGDIYFCAHNGKEFDFPYIARRMIVHNIVLPKPLQINELKPWEVKHYDTMELWKFGDRKNYTSLNLLANIFDIPSPKEDISGADIYKVYWEDKNIDRIKTYCEKDVVCLVKVFQRLQGLPSVKDEQIHFVME